MFLWHDHSSRGWGEEAREFGALVPYLFFVFSNTWSRTGPSVRAFGGSPCKLSGLCRQSRLD